MDVQEDHFCTYTYVTDVVLAVYIGILHVTSSLQSNKFTVSKVICFGGKKSVYTALHVFGTLRLSMLAFSVLKEPYSSLYH